ncbi:Sec-independent protein translocase protein TatB [Rhodophyticola sp. CCM32]|uniref:Sec-independent protein translocase protein TatB n=1 Tax=Rhodophyticola sp. CCM32 TaxID=2916397 RepID=UPI001EE5EC81|nr:Sec-independent protein translocase protein TatB [Rhodophyticola sp. CCM32]
MMELLVIGIVALIVVGPKDLPKMFRTFGQVTGRIRGMAKDFSRAMDEAAGETGMKDLGKDLRAMANPKKMGMDAVNKAFDGIEKDIDPTQFEEGSETRAMAEKRLADSKAAREQADALRKAREDDIRNAKLAAVTPGDASASATPVPAATADPVAAEPAPEAAAEPRTGTDQG